MGGKKLEELIVNAATTQPMFGDTRPPLIIMDEIDGALDGAIGCIAKLVKNKTVNRPIICIANNEYSSNLRPLRQICKIYKFRPISTRTLCKRLLNVCRKEFVHTDLKTLSYLTNITNNDIRACLHTLQFFKERGKRAGKRLSSRLTVNTLTNVPIGRKDKTQNIFDVWGKILKKRDQKKFNFQKKTAMYQEKEEWKEIAAMMYGLGDNNKVMNGVIANYLKLGYTDPLFQITFDTAQWIATFDGLENRIHSKQHWMLMGYLPFIMIAIHESCGTDTFQKLEYPSAPYKNRMALKQNMQIVHNFLHSEPDINAGVKRGGNDDEMMTVDVCQYSAILGRYYDINACVLELIPMIPFVIFTTAYWNNNDFNTNKDKFYQPQDRKHKSNKRHFVSIINTMIECGLNFVKSSQSSNVLELKPPIHKLSQYSFTDPARKRLAEYKNMNQYVVGKIAHQIVLEIMRRNESGINKYKKREEIINGNGLDKDEEDEMPRTMTPFMSTKQSKISSRLKGKVLNTPIGGGQFGAHKTTNFLSQQTGTNNPTPAKFKNFITAHNRKAKIEKYEYPVQYKFVEGYTNAVIRKSFCRDWI